jgi:hypothetical protein
MPWSYKASLLIVLLFPTSQTFFSSSKGYMVDDHVHCVFSLRKTTLRICACLLFRTAYQTWYVSSISRHFLIENPNADLIRFESLLCCNCNTTFEKGVVRTHGLKSRIMETHVEQPGILPIDRLSWRMLLVCGEHIQSTASSAVFIHTPSHFVCLGPKKVRKSIMCFCPRGL